MIGLAPGRLCAETPSRQNAERVLPVVSKLQGRGELRVAFSAHGRDFRLALAPNARLERWSNGQWHHYAGTLEGASGSWARVSVAGESLRGVIFDGQELLLLDPGDEGGAWVSRLGDQRFQQEISFLGDSLPAPVAKQFRGQGSGLPRMQALTAERKLEISAIGDAAFRARYASDSAARDA